MHPNPESETGNRMSSDIREIEQSPPAGEYEIPWQDPTWVEEMFSESPPTPPRDVPKNQPADGIHVVYVARVIRTSGPHRQGA